MATTTRPSSVADAPADDWKKLDQPTISKPSPGSTGRL
jgi:hypothetical protein